MSTFGIGKSSLIVAGSIRRRHEIPPELSRLAPRTRSRDWITRAARRRTQLGEHHTLQREPILSWYLLGR